LGTKNIKRGKRKSGKEKRKQRTENIKGTGTGKWKVKGMDVYIPKYHPPPTREWGYQ
jgi:hypothetical protein